MENERRRGPGRPSMWPVRLNLAVSEQDSEFIEREMARLEVGMAQVVRFALAAYRQQVEPKQPEQ